ncbi:MAG: PKD domain-containing protein, partial [Bdellovibrionaceae bacterium]|nr:PKD domain-containing protein [Pseudobdellovibrionaceae bacterium]
MKTTFSIIFVFAFVFIKFEKAQATSKTNQPPTINAYVSLTDPSNLRNVRVSLINSLDPDGNITKYQINFGDGYVSTKSDDEHQYSQDGSFTIKAKVWDNKNAVTEFTRTVQIKSNLVLSESVEAWSVADIKKNKQYSFNVSPNYVGSVYKVVLSHRENSSRWANLLAWLNDLLRRLTGKHNAKLEFALEINNISIFGANEVKDD